MGKHNGREHLLPEYAQAQENPWQVSWLVGWFFVFASFFVFPFIQLQLQASVLTQLAPRASLPPLSFVQGLFDVVNKILNEAGAANAHDAYINHYPASTGRLRPHQDRKQVRFGWLSWSSWLPVCCLRLLCCSPLRSK